MQPDGDAIARPRKGEPRPFDFRRPTKLNRDHVRTLEIVQETFARQFNTVLSSTLRAMSSVTVESIDQLSYDEFVRATPNPTHLSILSIHPLPGVAILQLPLGIALTAVDLMLGGHGKGNDGRRALTDIEVGLIRPLVDRILSELSYAFDSVVSFHPQVVQTESNPQFAQVAAPSDMIVVVTLDVRIESAQGRATLSLPYASLAPVLDSFTGNIVVTERDPAVAAQAAVNLRARLGDAPVDLSVRFAPLRLTSGDIVSLRVGDVLPLAQGTDAELTVTVGDVACFLGRPARRGKRLACQIIATQSEVPR